MWIISIVLTIIGSMFLITSLVVQKQNFDPTDVKMKKNIKLKRFINISFWCAVALLIITTILVLVFGLIYK